MREYLYILSPLAGCAFMLATIAVALYTARMTSRAKARLTAAEIRTLREQGQARAETRETLERVGDAEALARAAFEDVAGLRRELDDALSEVVGRLSAGGMDVTTGIDDDDAPTDPRIGAPVSGRVLVGPWGAQ